MTSRFVLILYPGMGHPASGKQFWQYVPTLLRKDFDKLVA
jgi:hypothetical protein